MEIQIRPCRLDDANAIYELNRMEMGYDYPEEKTKEKLKTLLKRSTDKIFVAEFEGAVVGYVHANNYDVIYAPHMKNIMGIAVSGEFRGRGIGKELLAAVEDWARETGASGIRLVSGEERIGAHEFYRFCGYCEAKRQVNFKKII